VSLEEVAVQGFAAAAGGVTLAISCLVAVRLVVVALRTRGAPEIAMGSYQVLVVAAIALYSHLSRAAVGKDPMLFFDQVVLANGLIATGVVALAVGIWRIYRAREAWAGATCAALSLWVVAGWAWTSTGEALPTTLAATASNAFFVAGRSSVYLWGGFEGIRYHRMLARRAELGLADPVVAHQILMWGLFSLAMGTLAVASLAMGVVIGDGYSSSPAAQLLTPAVSLVASICLWLGFFPPAAYRRMVARRASSAA
jgi:hypothetical protein